MSTRKEYLLQAKKNKKDEFYTQLEDIENELMHYKDQLKDKTVFCNCDDPEQSNFFKYFERNFRHLGLKRLISTHFDSSKRTYKLEVTQGLGGEPKRKKRTLKQNGDFRSSESIALLKEADVVITNPPFSLFREYVDQLVQYDKKFLIVGHQNAIGYKNVFKLIKENKLWLGYGFRGAGKFTMPAHYDNYQDGAKDNVVSVSGVQWFTNMETTKRKEEMDLFREYNDEDYPTYINYDAINVDKTKDIPMDYYGTIGVPLTFMTKYCPDQFEIEALGIVGSCEFKNNRRLELLKNGKPTGKFTMNAKGTLYRKHNPEKDTKPPAFKDVLTGELYSSIYSRILIKRRK